MPSGRGVTISVTAETDAGKRRHMEDYLDVRLAPNESLRRVPDLREQAFVGVFDGHGGKEAALYARERLWDLIQEQEKFRTTDRQQVVEAIEEAYWGLHKEMEPKRRTWKPNKLGDLSTAGTTACTVIFRQDHFYVANVGDSSAVLAEVNPRVGEDGQSPLLARMLSKDHKPEDPEETKRVESLGGQVKVSRKGVPRVVWERKKLGEGPGQTSTVDFIPFLSVSRSLGDFWSWSERTGKFAVSPQPDVTVHPLDASRQRFVVLASDGLWNVMSPQDVVDFVWDYETKEREEELMHQTRDVVRALIDEALYRWRRKGMFADNISVVIAFLTLEGVPPLGPSAFASSSQLVETSHDAAGLAAVEPRGAEVAGDENSRTTISNGTPPTEAATVHQVHATHSGSTVYHKETLPGGMVLEEHTVISLRCRRKDKQRAREQQEEGRQSHSPTVTGEGRQSHSPTVTGEGEMKRSPVKRPREDSEPSVVSSPPQKKSRRDRDSGCESDGGSSRETGPDNMEVTITSAEEPSSGVFSEDSCPETSVFPQAKSPTEPEAGSLDLHTSSSSPSPECLSQPAPPLISSDCPAVVVQV